MSNIATMTPITEPQTSKEVIAADVQLVIEQLEAGQRSRLFRAHTCRAAGRTLGGFSLHSH